MKYVISILNKVFSSTYKNIKPKRNSKKIERDRTERAREKLEIERTEREKPETERIKNIIREFWTNDTPTN